MDETTNGQRQTTPWKIVLIFVKLPLSRQLRGQSKTFVISAFSLLHQHTVELATALQGVVTVRSEGQRHFGHVHQPVKCCICSNDPEWSHVQYIMSVLYTFFIILPI